MWSTGDEGKAAEGLDRATVALEAWDNGEPVTDERPAVGEAVLVYDKDGACSWNLAWRDDDKEWYTALLSGYINGDRIDRFWKLPNYQGEDSNAI